MQACLKVCCNHGIFMPYPKQGLLLKVPKLAELDSPASSRVKHLPTNIQRCLTLHYPNLFANKQNLQRRYLTYPALHPAHGLVQLQQRLHPWPLRGEQ